MAIRDLGSQALALQADISLTADSALLWAFLILELLSIRCSPKPRFVGPRKTQNGEGQPLLAKVTGEGGQTNIYSFIIR